jgi:hypothetical protein
VRNSDLAADHTNRTRFPVLDPLLAPPLPGNTFTVPHVCNLLI